MWQEGELDEGSQKVQTSSYKISTRDVIFNMINIINMAICFGFLKIDLFIYLFIFGCVGSSFLCEGFLQLR